MRVPKIYAEPFARRRVEGLAQPTKAKHDRDGKNKKKISGEITDHGTGSTEKIPNGQATT